MTELLRSIGFRGLGGLQSRSRSQALLSRRGAAPQDPQGLKSCRSLKSAQERRKSRRRKPLAAEKNGNRLRRTKPHGNRPPHWLAGPVSGFPAGLAPLRWNPLRGYGISSGRRAAPSSPRWIQCLICPWFGPPFCRWGRVLWAGKLRSRATTCTAGRVSTAGRAPTPPGRRR